MIWADWLVVVFAILLIVVVLIQQSQDDIQDAFSGEKSELFKNRKDRGMELYLSRATGVLSILFIVFVVISYVSHL